MKESEIVSDIINHDVVGNQVSLEARTELLAQVVIGIDPNRVGRRKQEKVRIELSFGVQNARFLRRLGIGLADIVGRLAVEKSNPICANNT
jgi:hypothetical protein